MFNSQYLCYLNNKDLQLRDYKMYGFKKLILGLFIFSLGCSCVFAQNYSIHSMELYNAGVALQRNGQFEQAEQKYLQALQIQPNLTEANDNLATLYKNWANKYFKSSDYNNAIKMYKKSLSIDSSDQDTLQALAQTYLMNNQFDKAVQIYNKILITNPNDEISIQNLKYASSKIEDSKLNNSLNNLNELSPNTAPNALYGLIKPAAGISSSTVSKTKVILNLIWSDSNGRIILTALIKSRIPINITQCISDANATSSSKKNTFYLYGFIPIFSCDSSSLVVNVPFNYVSNVNNSSLSSYQRIYSLHVFIHEFCHAFRTLKYPNSHNSIEEELGASMIGYNIAYKILTGNYMNREQTQRYSKACLEALLKDSHRDLPIHSGFNEQMQAQGIKMPYPEVYSNLDSIYQGLLQEQKIRPVANFQRTKN